MVRSVLILARGVQASRLGAYGAAWSLTPNIDRLASQSLVMDRFLSTTTCRNSWGNELVKGPNPGIWAADREDGPGVENGLASATLPKVVGPAFEKTLTEVIATWRKKKTAWLVLDLGDALPPWNPENQDLEAYFPTPSTAPASESEDKEMAPVQVEVIPEGDEEPSEIQPWLTPLDDLAKTPQSPASTSPIRERLLLSHAAAIATLDRKVGIILDLLAGDQTGDFHIFLTSDGGIGVGDKKTFGGSPETPWLDLVQLPLIWCHPSRVSVGLRTAALLGDQDLFHFVNSGRTLESDPFESCWSQPRWKGRGHLVTLGKNGARAVRNSEYGLVVDSAGAQHLYHFPLDHWEVNDLGSQNPGEVAALAQLLEIPA